MKTAFYTNYFGKTVSVVFHPVSTKATFIWKNDGAITLKETLIGDHVSGCIMDITGYHGMVKV